MSEDLAATIGQSAVDKLLGSVNYPFVAFDHSWSFQTDFANAIGLTIDQSTDLLERAEKQGINKPHDAESELLSELYISATEIIEIEKLALREGKITDPSDRKKVQEVVDLGVAGLAKFPTQFFIS